jgi:CRISPR-associated protein Csm3
MAENTTGPRLRAKRFIRGRIVTQTGLHVGGSRSALDIGGIDLNVTKTAGGVPFIPGSSLKGKLRSILAREEGSRAVKQDSEVIQQIFGTAGDAPGGQAARLIVRDAFLDLKDFERKKNGDLQDGEAGWNLTELEMEYTEVKWETAIDRLTGTAKGGSLRDVERVPAGAVFAFEMVYNVLDDGREADHLAAIRRAMRILEDDYLGGQGSRGYGRIRFEGVRLEEKTISDYQGENEARRLEEDFLG